VRVTADPDHYGGSTWLGIRHGQIWVYDQSRPGLVLVDPNTRRLTVQAPSPATGRASEVAADGNTLWLLGYGAVGRIELDHGRPIGSRLELGRHARGGTIVYAGSLWTTAPGGGAIVRIDPP
jgi:hypothetical protein